MFDPNIITSIGVFLLLIAFFGNSSNFLPKNKLYYTLNLVGGILACYGAFVVNLYPIVILEGVWTIVSSWELLQLFMNPK
jgi:hypothetical protein